MYSIMMTRAENFNNVILIGQENHRSYLISLFMRHVLRNVDLSGKPFDPYVLLSLSVTDRNHTYGVFNINVHKFLKKGMLQFVHIENDWMEQPLLVARVWY